VIEGFKFTHAAGHAKSDPGTSFCRWTDNIFETPGKGDYLNVSGEDHEVDYNTFQNKNSLGKFIAIRGEGSQIARRLWIHHNYFHDFLNQGGANGAEAFQFGLSGFSLSSSNSVVEHNLFERCAGENELISVKASEVILRYNTIRDCPAQFTLRHGNRCQVYGNYFFNTPGLRIFGDDHLIFSNYFQGCSMAINIGNGDGEVADGAKLTSHDRPDRVRIAFNTLVKNKRNIVQTPRKSGLGATAISFAYNVIVGGERAADISGPLPGTQWKHNIIFNTQPGDIPPGGFESFEPMLTMDERGFYHPSASSKLRDYAREAFPDVSVDMEGQARSDKFADAGADEISESAVEASVLSPSDVGSFANKLSHTETGKK
jgi:poly(beta-D-mannuronate) lyase